MTPLNRHFLLLFGALLLFACAPEQKGDVHNAFHPEVVLANGYRVPTDSMAPPIVVVVDERRVTQVPAGKPTEIRTNTNVHLAGSPEIIPLGELTQITPGKEGVPLPKKVAFSDSTFVGAEPEVVLAKNAYVKEQNPEGFSSIGKLQGLKQDAIRFMMQDKIGNLWIATGGGVSKYDGHSFTHFTEKEGLPGLLVWDILEDRKGDLWFATSGGLCKYNGVTFTHFKLTETDGKNSVRCLIEDRKGIVWFGTNHGLHRFDGKSLTVYTDKEGLPGNSVNALLEDSQGNIWIGTFGGVGKFNGTSFTAFTEKVGLQNNFIYAIHEDRKQNLWFGTLGGACKFDGQSFQSYTQKEGLSGPFVKAIFEAANGNLWFGTFSNGVSKFDGKTFTHFTESEGLSNNSIQGIFEDNARNLWIGTSGGVNKYDGKTFTHFTQNSGLSNKNVLALAKDQNGHLWFGTYGGGVNKYDGHSFSQYTQTEGLANNYVFAVFADSKGNMWFGTDLGVSKFDGKSFTTYTEENGLSSNSVWSIAEDKAGNLWFGTYNGGVSKFNGTTFVQYGTKQGLSSMDVWSLLVDKAGNLWFGTAAGINKFDGKTFTHYTEKEGLLSNEVRSIVEDADGNLWIGANEGVNVFDGKTFTHITEKEGLPNNFVGSIYEDKNHTLWFGTRFGLSKLSANKKHRLLHLAKTPGKKTSEGEIFFKNYYHEDGFLGIGVNTGKTLCQSDDGALWIAANDRLTVYHPQGDHKERLAPAIKLTGLGLFNEGISWLDIKSKKDTSIVLGNGVLVTDVQFDGLNSWYHLPTQLSLPHNNNYLNFQFIGVTMNQPKKVNYQYKLEGLDQNWSAISDKTEAAYGNLPHGTYTFRVKALNNEGMWSAPASYTFTIRPPWWKTTWFRLTYILLGILLLYFIFRWRTATLRRQKLMLERTVMKRTQEVVAEKRTVEQQKHLIEEKHKEITDSINYAERIQRSFLATKEVLDQSLNDYFIFFQPKDVVSGDFYWGDLLENGRFVLVTADSTGHGVPGAIMSIANIACLKESIAQGLVEPDAILNKTRERVIESLKNDGSTEGGSDGMDASLICFDFDKMQFSCAAANNPVWVVRDQEIIELKGDRMPVGKHAKDSVPFSKQHFELQKGDLIYTLTDGVADQFGGPIGKKYKSSQLKTLLLSLAELPMQEQADGLREAFFHWKGDLEQTDDVLVIGIRV